MHNKNVLSKLYILVWIHLTNKESLKYTMHALNNLYIIPVNMVYRYHKDYGSNKRPNGSGFHVQPTATEVGIEFKM